MKKVTIEQVTGREILDSRGNPTVEAEVVLSDGTVGTGKAPSGASTGKYEACELRDKDISRYGGKGTLCAAGNISKKISPILKGICAYDIQKIDSTMIALDGTENKSLLGANAVLSVSIAACDAAAKSLGIPLYRFLGGVNARYLPVPMMNILNGGAHSDNNVDIQEFMIMPVGANNFTEALMQCSSVYHHLGEILKKRGLAASVGDEGGYAPDLDSDETAIEFILEAVSSAGFYPGTDFVLALDAAASEWKGEKKGEYRLPKSGKVYNSEELISHFEALCDKYPIRSVEDPLDEEDVQGWKSITARLGNKIQLVGDDLFVTNTKRIQKGINENFANAVLIKPNQIGTVSETIEAVNLAKRKGFSPVMSHRSGETEDTFIADLAVALGVLQIKTGAPSRSERVAKYNRLLKIEQQIEKSSEKSYGDCF